MIGTLHILTELWPHCLFVIATAVVSVRIRSWMFLALMVGGMSVAAAIFYWTMQNGISPPVQSARTGQVVAMMIAGTVPLLGAGLSGRAAASEGKSPVASIVAATAVGMLLLLPMPVLQVLLGCAFSGICL
jgi:hypothetical protein